MDAWPLESSLWRPLCSLLFAGLWPLLSTRLIRTILIPDASESANRATATTTESAKQSHPFPPQLLLRTHTLLTLTELIFSALFGFTALGPMWVSQPLSPAAVLFALCTTATTYFAQGFALWTQRELLQDPRSLLRRLRWRSKIILTLLSPISFLAGAVIVCTPTPYVENSSPDLAPLILSYALCIVAFVPGALLSGFVFRIVRLGPKRLQTLITRGGESRVKPWLVLVCHTKERGLTFVYTLPWLRVVILTDTLLEALEERELAAMMAHQGARLTHPIWPSLVQSLIAVTVLWALGPGLWFMSQHGSWFGTIILGCLLGSATVGLRRLRSYAQESISRADDVARQNGGAAHLGSALQRIHAANHPDGSAYAKAFGSELRARLQACGKDLPPKPKPHSTRMAYITALSLSIGLCALTTALWQVSSISAEAASTVEPSAAHWRSFVSPWDGEAILASGWQACREDQFERARILGERAHDMGVSAGWHAELRAEIEAAQGHCDAARALFDESIRRRADETFRATVFESSLALGSYPLTPSLITQCGQTEPALIELPSP